LFVTGAFNFSGAGFASARDEGFAFDGAAFALVFGAAFATVFVTAMLGVFDLPASVVATGFLTAGFAIDLLDADLVAAEFAFFAGDIVFAVFFCVCHGINTKMDCSRLRRVNCAWWSRFALIGSAFARATFTFFLAMLKFRSTDEIL